MWISAQRIVRSVVIPDFVGARDLAEVLVCCGTGVLVEA